MEGRLQRFLLGIGLLLGMAAPVLAADAVAPEREQAIEPQLERRQLDEALIDTEDFELGAFAGLMSIQDFGVNPVYGARAAYHVTERFFMEAAFGQSEADRTSYERLSGSVDLLSGDERNLTYYNLSLGYNVFPGEVFVTRGRTYNTDLYVIAGIGSTRFAGDDRFTVNGGLGYRVLVSDWFAVHFDVRDHIFDLDLLGEETTNHNLELHGGATFFF